MQYDNFLLNEIELVLLAKVFNFVDEVFLSLLQVL